MKIKNCIVLVSVLLLVAGCEFTLWEPDQDAETGKLSIYITDAPFPFDIVEEANVTITRVEIANESDSEEVEFITISEDSSTFNLLELRNGVTANLLEANVPIGVYNRLRLYIAESSILLTDGRVFDLKVPSGEQTGIKVKINPDIIVDSLMSSEVLLDFDVSKSFVLNGNTKEPDKIKGFKFKPVVRAVNYSSAGTIAGTVTNSDRTVLKNMEVWIKLDTIVTTAYTNDKGIYGMLGIPEGNYSMYATGNGYDTAVYDMVEVFEGERIIKNFTLNPL